MRQIADLYFLHPGGQSLLHLTWTSTGSWCKATWSLIATATYPWLSNIFIVSKKQRWLRSFDSMPLQNLKWGVCPAGGKEKERGGDKYKLWCGFHINKVDFEIWLWHCWLEKSNSVKHVRTATAVDCHMQQQLCSITLFFIYILDIFSNTTSMQ